jgi:hypothetical protein
MPTNGCCVRTGRERGQEDSGGVDMSLQVLLRWSTCLAPAVLTVEGAIMPAYGQHSYPVRPIRMIASQSAGSGVDAVARLAAARLTEAFRSARRSGSGSWPKARRRQKSWSGSRTRAATPRRPLYRAPMPADELPAWISGDGGGEMHDPDRPSGLLH